MGIICVNASFLPFLSQQFPFLLVLEKSPEVVLVFREVPNGRGLP